MCPDFSVILTTRNRPELFEIALKSVLMQEDISLEVVVVNDGSSEDFLPAYHALEKTYKDNTRFIYLIPSMGGHGQSYAINQGALHASGTYIALLDDDDYWTDPQHLARAKHAFAAEDDTFSIYCALQEAWLRDKKLTHPIWLDKNLDTLIKTPAKIEDVYYAKRADVIKNGVFSQVNTLIFTRDLFMQIKGFDEHILYEGDREFFIRLIDQVEHILFLNKYVSKHHVPDQAKTDNFSTSVKRIGKLQCQLTLYSKLMLESRTEDVRYEAKLGYGYTLKHLTEQLAMQGNLSAARYYAWIALASQFSFKWLGYSLYLSVKSLFK